MKKCKLIFTVATVLLLSLIMAVTASAANAPTRENAEEIFFDMGLTTWGGNYFGCSMQEPDGENAPDNVVFEYMYLSGMLDDYYNDGTGYYTIAYDEYIGLVDKTFVNHSDMKDFLAGLIDPETNLISWREGGFDGSQTWIVTDYCVKGDYCYATGVFADRDIEAYPDFPAMEYGKESINTDDYQAVIISGLILTLQNTEDGWKILEYRETDYYVVDDMLYSDNEMFYRFTIEDNGKVNINQNDDSVDFVTGFYGVAGVWHPEISNHSYNIKADENYVIESVVLTDANGETVLDPVDDVYTFDVVGIASLKVTTRGVPAIKEYEGGLAYFVGNDIAVDYSGLLRFEGVLYYIENGIVRTDYTGLCESNGSYYYISNGVLDNSYTGLTCYYDVWYYISNGAIDRGYTGLVYHYGNYYYVNNGVLDWNFTGLVEHYGGYYHVQNGFLDWNYSGLSFFNGNYYYVSGAMLDNSYTGLTCYYGVWYYVANGVLDWNYTGLTCYYDVWYYVANGVLDWNYTGITNYYDTWYYVSGGILDWGYTGLTEYYGSWYYVAGGVLDWGYTGLTEYYGTWYYVSGGVLDWSYTGLAYHYGTWYYVNNGVLDWSYTGIVYHYGTWYYVSGGTHISYTGFCEYYGVWYFIRNGSIQWDYTGTYSYYGTSYYVNNGVVDFSFTGICFGGMEGAVYVVNGVVDRGFTGLCENNGSWYHVENGRLTNQSLLFEQDGVVYYVDHGIVNFYFTGFVQVDYYWLYIEDGIWDYTFTGKVDLEDGTFAYIEEGVVVDIR